MWVGLVKDFEEVVDEKKAEEDPCACFEASSVLVISLIKLEPSRRWAFAGHRRETPVLLERSAGSRKSR